MARPELDLKPEDALAIYHPNRSVASFRIALFGGVVVLVLGSATWHGAWESGFGTLFNITVLLVIFGGFTLRNYALLREDPSLVVVREGLILHPVSRPYTILPWSEVKAVTCTHMPYRSGLFFGTGQLRLTLYDPDAVRKFEPASAWSLIGRLIGSRRLSFPATRFDTPLPTLVEELKAYRAMER